MIALLEHMVEQYGYGVVGLIICLESMGLPLPGESLLIAAAIYAATTGKLQIEWIVLSAAAGAIIGDNLGYIIGRRLGRPALEKYGPRFWLTVERQRLGHYLFYRFGGVVVFFGRFIGFLRIFAALLAGANGMEWKRFLMWNALGGVVWTHLYGIGAYLLGNQFIKLAGPVGLAVGIAAAVVVVAAVMFLKRHEHRLIAQAEAAMAAHEAEVAARKRG